jgi:phosphinothricin acetyltransferase
MEASSVRPATDADIAAITAIYDHYVRTSAATFEIDPPDAAEMARRRLEIEAKRLPYVVAEVKGAVAGYAYASSYRPRFAYRFTVEDSVYIHPDYVRKGLGRKLLGAVIAGCEARGCRQMMAVIGDTANTGSIRLHENDGFRHAGTLHAVGFKFGRWVSTVLMQRQLGPGAETLPEPGA